MALSAELKKALKDLKIGDESVLSIVSALDDKASAKDKVQKANDDLVSQREKWETEKKDLKQSNANSEKSLSDIKKDLENKNLKISVLEKEKLSPEDLKKLKHSDDLEAELNKLRDDNKKNAEEIEAERKLRIATEEKSKQVNIESVKQSQRTNLSNELSKHKITGVKNRQALNDIFGEGFAKLIINDDGTAEEKYFTKASNNSLKTADFAGMIKTFAESNLHLVDGSDNAGTGQNHNSTNDAIGHYANMRDEKAAAANLMQS